ncbi:hypothetical protein ACHAXN_008608 [Cyclotella atomus]
MALSLSDVIVSVGQSSFKLDMLCEIFVQQLSNFVHNGQDMYTHNFILAFGPTLAVAFDT